MAGEARLGMARRGVAWYGRQGLAWLGRARRGKAWQGMAGEVRFVQVWQCWVRRGLEGLGRLGMVCSGGER